MKENSKNNLHLKDSAMVFSRQTKRQIGKGPQSNAVSMVFVFGKTAKEKETKNVCACVQKE